MVEPAAFGGWGIERYRDRNLLKGRKKRRKRTHTAGRWGCPRREGLMGRSEGETGVSFEVPAGIVRDFKRVMDAGLVHVCLLPSWTTRMCSPGTHTVEGRSRLPQVV